MKGKRKDKYYQSDELLLMTFSSQAESKIGFLLYAQDKFQDKNERALNKELNAGKEQSVSYYYLAMFHVDQYTKQCSS